MIMASAGDHPVAVWKAFPKISVMMTPRRRPRRDTVTSGDWQILTRVSGPSMVSVERTYG
jgi:hypothetical protein